jgi:monofunctional biosynthetic peptidoglycan transglycosylase
MMRTVLKWIRNIIIIAFLSSIAAVFLLKYVPVYYTPLMFIRMFDQISEGKDIKMKHKWVPIEEISRNMPQAVVASEDNLFLQHTGFDLKQIKIARKEAERGKRVRGASTISQQTAKNVFLWPGKSFIRKGLEAYFTLLIEWIWGKERIMEVYLNSIEMGDGIYGVEAVSRANFNKPAKKLTRNEAALIAATLPNPIRFSSANPSNYMRKRQRQIASLMGKIENVGMGYDASRK